MLLLLFFLNLAHADMQAVASKLAASESRAMPAPRKLIALSEVKAHFSSNPENLKLVALCEVLGLTSISAQGAKVENVQAQELAQAIGGAIKLASAWEKKLSPQQIVVVDASQETLKQHFTDQGMEWAWVLKTLGQGAASKSLLMSLFDKKSSELLGTQFIFKSENPLSHLTILDRVLTPQSSKEENQARSQKLQKVKTHISNLPDATIMT